MYLFFKVMHLIYNPLQYFRSLMLILSYSNMLQIMLFYLSLSYLTCMEYLHM